MTELPPRHDQVLVWGGRSGWSDTPKDAEEESVEREWGFGQYDARTHPLFSLLREHLAPHSCWAELEQAEEEFRIYRDACERFRGVVWQEVKNRVPDHKDAETMGAMVQSLMSDAYYQATCSSGGLRFSYEPQKVQVRDKPMWHLELGAWGVGLVQNLAELEPIASTHRELTRVLPGTAELKELCESDAKARLVMDRFQRGLYPDALLRKLVVNGRCCLCP